MPTLDWIGKTAVVKHHLQVPYRVIHCERGESVGAVGDGNLLVEGDNLDALKALLPYYAGKVMCIYIDPPYNTGNEGWVYNDNVNAPEMKKWLGEVVGRDDLSRHDKWLCMMYPRLVLLRELLREDGAIFISIDDNEVANLRAIMDDIFKARNFVATIIWQKTFSPKNTARHLSESHDYILLYAKNLAATIRAEREESHLADEPRAVISKYALPASFEILARPRKCPTCEHHFIPRTPTQKYCGERCARVGRKAQRTKKRGGRK